MKYQDFRKKINKPYFTTDDIRLRALNIYNYQITLWQKRGLIERLKRGIYVFSEDKKDLSAREVALVIFNPSYISLEYALSQYGIIPEMIYSITSVTTKKTRELSNVYGDFVYQHVKPDLFFGYESVETDNANYLIATPEKALLDYIYLNLGRIDDLEDIKELRINPYQLKETINVTKLKEYSKEFNIKKLDYIIKEILSLC